jgi:LemA protein
MPLLIIIGVLAVIGLYVMGVYNSLQQLKTQIVASIQEIGNQLKRQASLIPNLESSVRGYMKHEKDIFTMLTDARKSALAAQESGKASDIDAAIQKMASVVPKLSVAIEDNPELKADQTVTRFMDELTDTADKLSYSRRSVIDLTANYNQQLVMFPSNIIAGLFGFKPEKGLETPMTGSHVSVSDKETQDVKVSL